MGNWHTRPNVKSTTDDVYGHTDTESTPDQPLCCYCRRPEDGTMIGCDNPDCPIEWFHVECLKLPPKGKSKQYCH